MLVLIAESKTMAPCLDKVSPEVYAAHRPMMEDRAEAVMDSLRGTSESELAARVGISAALARRLREMVYEFPNKTLGAKAIEAFTGVVFKAFDYGSLNSAARGRTAATVRIVSSLYGWLRPDDIVKAYRLDFKTSVAPDGLTLAASMRDRLGEALVAELDSRGSRAVLDLMPGEALGGFARSTLRLQTEMWTAVFREMLPGGSYKTPDAGWLKTLRGKLLRLIVENGIDKPEELAGIGSDDFMCESVDGHRLLFTAVR